MDDYELLSRFYEIFNEYQSSVTGWPHHRIVKNGRRWRTSREKHDVWFHRNFVSPDLLRLNISIWTWDESFLSKNKEGITREEYYKDFYRSDFGFTHAVRKDFLLRVITLGYVSAKTEGP